MSRIIDDGNGEMGGIELGSWMPNNNNTQTTKGHQEEGSFSIQAPLLEAFSSTISSDYGTSVLGRIDGAAIWRKSRRSLWMGIGLGATLLLLAGKIHPSTKSVVSAVPESNALSSQEGVNKVVETIPTIEPLPPLIMDTDDDDGDAEDPPPATVFGAHEMEIVILSENEQTYDDDCDRSFHDSLMSMSADGTRIVISTAFPSGSKNIQAFEWDDGTNNKNKNNINNNNKGWIRLGPENLWGEHFSENNNGNNQSYHEVRVAMSADGNRIAISGLLSTKLDAENKVVPVAGVVDVLEWQDGEWQRVGQSIEVPLTSYWIGYISVALSGDGSRIVVGASTVVHSRWDYRSSSTVRNGDGHAGVLDWSGSDWIMVWEFVPVEEGVITEIGHTVAISMDGSRVVVGTVSVDYCGGTFAQVFAWNESTHTFEEVGANGKINPIDNLKMYGFDRIEAAVSLDGKRVAVSPAHFQGGKTEGGHVKVFGQGEDNTFDGHDANASSPWQQLGSDIDGEFDIPDCSVDDIDHNIYAGSMAMSLDGSRIVVGSVSSSLHTTDGMGHVRVFDWTAAQRQIGGHYWEKVGPDLDRGSEEERFFGTEVAMSSDGTRIAVMFYRKDEDSLSTNIRFFDSV